ncbi:MAG: sulfite oxidase [Thermoplasmata archaeon]
MPLFVAEHEHAPDRCPAGNPKMAPFLLQILSKDNAQKQGLRIEADAVIRGKHHLVVVVEGPSEEAVRAYLAPFALAGSLTVAPASNCEEVVARGAC